MSTWRTIRKFFIRVTALVSFGMIFYISTVFIYHYIPMRIAYEENTDYVTKFQIVVSILLALIDYNILFRLLFTLDPGYVTPKMAELIYKVNGVEPETPMMEAIDKCNEAYFTRQGIIQEDIENSQRGLVEDSRRAKISRALRQHYSRFPNYEFLNELVSYKHCKKCDQIKPPRAHHCSICGKCVLRMDHHCPWVGTCVGFVNHKMFLLF